MNEFSRLLSQTHGKDNKLMSNSTAKNKVQQEEVQAKDNAYHI